MGTIGSEDSKLNVLTIVHYKLSFDEAEKNKSVFEILPGLFKLYFTFLKDVILTFEINQLITHKY